MSLDHAILGFLNYTPYSGYDLKKVFDTSVRHFWPADQSQIYRTLTRLVERGWAEVEVVEQEVRPDRKVYHITPAGQAELRRWLTVPIPFLEPRMAALVQVFFAGQLPDEELLPIFERAAEEMRSVLELYSQAPEAIREGSITHHAPRDAFFWGLTLELGVAMLQAELAWSESVIERIVAKRHPAA